MKKEIRYIKPFLSDISEDLKEKILSQIGLNTISFQFLEKLLKVAIPKIDFKVYYKDLENKDAWNDPKQFSLEIRKCMEKFISKINKETLGSLVSRFLNIYDQGRSDSIHEESYFEEPGLILSKTYSIDWTLIKGSKKDIEKKIRVWENLVQERNKAVHHLAFEYDLNCSKSCEKLLKYLKKQGSEIHGCINDLGEIMKMAEDAFETYNKLESKRFQKAERFHDLFNTINVVLSNFHEKDGWASLSVVGDLIKKRALKDLKEYKSVNRCRTLKEVLLKSNLYDVRKEGKTVWFRLKPK